MPNNTNPLRGAKGTCLSPEQEQLREALAALEHEQWCEWSHNLAESEQLSPERLSSWAKRWVPYSELSEEDKDLDRLYADQVLELIARAGSPNEAAPEGADR
jgi:hypothetical protein